MSLSKMFRNAAAHALLAAGAVVASATNASDAYKSPLPVQGTLPSLAGATGWLNGAPLSAEALRGKVVLVDFWTYSCINCIRTIPYVRAWAWCRWPASTRCAWSSTWPGATRSCVSSSIP